LPYYLVLAVAGLDVHAVELVFGRFLIAFAFKYFNDVYLFAQQHCNESLKDTEVCLVAKHTLGGPVETYVLVVDFHDCNMFWLEYCKDSV